VIWPDGAAPSDATYVVGWLSSWVVNSGNRDNAFSGAAPRIVPLDGRFDAAVDPSSDTSPVLVRVVASGFAPADSAPLKIDPATKETSVEIRPDLGAHFAGRVVAKGGDEPVAGAAIRLRFVDPSRAPPKDEWYQNAPRPVVGPIAATTDAKGAFDIESLARGRYDVQIQAPGFAWWTKQVDLPSDAMRVELPRLGVLSGRAHFADGSPAAGVCVSVDGQTYRADTTSDADGRFRFDDATPGGLTVHVYAPFDGTGTNVRQLQVKGWQHAGDDLDVVVERGLAISGRLVLAGGAPFLGSAIVRAFSEGSNYAAEGVGTRPDGSFSLRGLGPGRYRVGVEMLRQPGDPPMRCASVEGVDAGTSGLALTVQSGLSIDGVLEIPPEAERLVRSVRARRPGVRGMDANREPGTMATLDANGAFRFDGLDPGQYVVVVQDQFGCDSPWQAGEAARVEAGATDVRLALSTATTISGEVVFDGAPLPSCDVYVRAVGDDSDTCGTISWTEGRFTFVGLAPGKRWDVTAHRAGLLAARAANVAVGAAGLRLELTSGLSITGRVLRADGSAFSKANVVLQTGDGKDAGWASCDEKGAFEAHGLAAGDFVAKVYVPPAKEGEAGAYVEVGRVRAGDAGVELRLPR
jgi:hypothetical protein